MKMEADVQEKTEAEVISMKIFPTHFENFEMIKEAGDFHDYDANLEACPKRRAIFLSEPSHGPAEFALYWEGQGQFINGNGNERDYFRKRGYGIIECPHPSMIINAARELSEDRLCALGVPQYVNIVLPNESKSCYVRTGRKSPCYLNLKRSEGKRTLELINIDGIWNEYFAFLLQKL